MSQTEKLVDLIVRLALEKAAPEIETLVGHRFPDDDVWLCCWTAKKFILKAVNAQIVFVNAGESLPGSEGNPSILHFDTGGGEYDQHNTGRWKTPSATLLVEKLGLLTENPGLKPLLEMVKAVDNIKPLQADSIHYTIEGYPRQKKFQNHNGSINWQLVQERVFELFDIVYEQETARVKAREKLQECAEWTTFPNGIRVCSILWNPECREAAFKAGAHVVVWTQSKGSNHFYTGVQTSRNYPLFLDGVVAALRSQESKARKETTPNNLHLRSVGRLGSPWFLHDSKRLILNGSRSWKPTKEEYTRLVPRQVVGLVHRTLSAIPIGIVSQWEKQK